jgi:hypothetical protein
MSDRDQLYSLDRRAWLLAIGGRLRVEYDACASKAALCATGRARTAADTNAVHDRLLQSMRVRFSNNGVHQLSLRARKIM